MSNKLYIVSELGYEYDDNNYYRGEGSGGYPRAAYSSEEKAKQVCDNLNLQEFKDLFSNRQIQNYGDLGYLVDPDDEDTNKIFNKYFGTDVSEWWDNSSVDWVVKPTEDAWVELYDRFQVSWYSVTSVKVED